ncbi:hypothetical protein CUN61_22210 [Pseudomonas arsenicoxydans]|uniref:DUF1534 domain-containing protein n=1 Tax=Pseudomonas arsenicoxydans TaxID=702115 RepID=A0A4P6GLS4_9PSED|nr:hypothetical protein CUN61_22210 [Pseudomonas arsenicoxydans]
MLRVGMHPVTLRVTLAQDSSLVSTAERRASPAAFPRGAWERSTATASRAGPLPQKADQRTAFASHHSSGRALARLPLLILILICPGRPNAGSAQWATRHGCRVSRPRPWMADGGGPTEQDRSEGMPSLGEAPYVRGASAWLLGAGRRSVFPSDPPSGRNQ